jgi:DNA-binding CsgD family transcriptional regulator
VIARLLASSTTAEGPIGRLSPREREVLELMAEGPSDDGNRRVLAVLAYLGR